MSKRSKEDYTYLEWITCMRQRINISVDQEVVKISHDDGAEQSRTLIEKIKKHIEKFESQIPDDIAK